MHKEISLNVDPKSKNLYVLFGWEAIEARPNLDPYTSTLRIDEETQQVFTTDVHLKHHTRRGIKVHASEKFGPEKTAIFYEKKDEHGEARNFDERLSSIRSQFNLKEKNEQDAYVHCLDLPLFGYVHAVTGENFNAVNAINTLFRPSTFHACRILSLGKNNAFPTGERESSGSAVQDVLEYGFFLALWEVSLNVLEANAKNHKVISWPEQGAKAWLELFLNGLWRAYTDARYSSATQRSQFANFIVAWEPKGEITPLNPKNLIQKLEEPEIENSVQAKAALQKLLPDFLKAWSYQQPLAERNLAHYLGA
jgi:CRISPR/Cas system type I-B associated protein Csh2 (Cas7 group RAMP superfamily)